MSNIGPMGKRTFVNVFCTNNGKTVKADLVKFDKDNMIVILPNYQKLILKKSETKPRFYTTQLYGMEFTCTLEEKVNV